MVWSATQISTMDDKGRVAAKRGLRGSRTMHAIKARHSPISPAQKFSPCEPLPHLTTHSGIVGQAWQWMSHGAANLLQTVTPLPTVPRAPYKIKQVADAAFARFQQHLAKLNIPGLPYCPRQFHTKSGERYVLSRAYAFGTFGRVHIGVRSSDGREVAVKEIPVEGKWKPSPGTKELNPHASWHKRKCPSPLEHIESELAMAKRAGDAPLDVFAYDGRTFIVTDLMAGDAFGAVDYLNAHPTPCGHRILALSLLQGVAEKMSQVHARGVVHRDLKLENVLRSRTGQWHITDWGWATELAPKSCMWGVRVGTMGAIPLEVLRGEMTDHRFDVFSLGVMVVTAALGRRIFDSKDMSKSAQEIAAFEDWLRSIRDPVKKRIDLQKLSKTRGRFANAARDLIRSLGLDLAIFIMDRMLTGTITLRASMAETVAVCKRIIPAALLQQSAAMCEAIAELETDRNALMDGITLFDEYFPYHAALPPKAPTKKQKT